MIRVCYRCKKVYGEKAPLDDKTETHGLCETCFPIDLAETKAKVEELRKKGFLKPAPKQVEDDLPTLIDVPLLTLRQRMALDKADEAMERGSGFEEASKAMCKAFSDFTRAYRQLEAIEGGRR